MRFDDNEDMPDTNENTRDNEKSKSSLEDEEVEVITKVPQIYDGMCFKDEFFKSRPL